VTATDGDSGGDGCSGLLTAGSALPAARPRRPATVSPAPAAGERCAVVLIL